MTRRLAGTRPLRAAVAAGLAAVPLVCAGVCGFAWPRPAARAQHAAALKPHEPPRAWQAREGRAHAAQVAATPPPVVLAGIPGLAWTDLSPRGTPQLWRLAAAGSGGALVVRTVLPRSCPVDGWLTLNAGARAMARHTEKGACPPIPPPAALPAIARYNQRFHYNPHWGLLASAAGPAGCVTAAGPGAALALARLPGHGGPPGPASLYLPDAAGLTRSVLARCPLTVADLGAVPGASGTASRSHAAAVRAADTAAGRIAAAMPPGGILVVAAPADAGATPHLRVLIVSGPGYRAGLLATVSTRQPGLVQLTDLTAAIMSWRHQPLPVDLVGSPLTRQARGSLAASVRELTGQDTAAQVYHATFGWFFAAYAAGDCAVFGAIILLGWGASGRDRRRAGLRIAGVLAGAVVPGSFLASLVPWWLLPHPAVMLYLMTAAWAAVIAAAALAGPWRRDPFGPPGVVGAITVAVVGIDVMTGSRLQLGTPFGLSVLVGGRFYGVGNNALGPYGAAGLLAAAWLALVAARRRGARRDAVLAVTGVGAFTVIASGWPGFGSKFGGTVAMVPGFILLGLCAAGVRVTARRAVALTASGVAAVIVFALVSYFVPVTGHSHIGEFVGQVLHGGAGGVLQRKISSNIGSLTITPYSPLVPIVMIALGLLLLRPQWFGAWWLPGRWAAQPLLRATMAAQWVVAALGWLADDSGVTVAAAALPFALPLAIAIHVSVPRGAAPRQPTRPAPGPAARPVGQPGGG